MRKMLLAAIIFLAIPILACGADEIKGRITAVDVATGSIDISGVKVLVQNARIENEMDMPITVADLRTGDYLDVEGSFSGAGQMMAMKIEKDYPEQDEIKGMIQSVDAAGNSLVIGGITVKIAPGAWLEGHGDMRITVGQFAAGYYVECKGAWTGQLVFTANKVEMD